MFTRCSQIKSLISYELSILSNKMKEKGKTSIEEKEQFAEKFVKYNAQKMRNVYCSQLCLDRSNCSAKRIVRQTFPVPCSA